METNVPFRDADAEPRLPPGTLRRVVRNRVRHKRQNDSLVQSEEQLPKPIAIMPFIRDPNFVDRRDVFNKIQQKCTVPGSRIALVGLGGVGKSQLAIEFACRTLENAPETWVFWIHTSNATRFEQGFRNIAGCIKTPQSQNPEADIFQTVHDWLRDEKNGKWLIILDNVDDAGFLLASSSSGERQGKIFAPLISYLPQCPQGNILLTSRSKNEALKLIEQDKIIMVEPMIKHEALVLLRQKLGQQDETEAFNLATILDFMPLAMVQAAAYISQRRPRYSVKQYLLDFHSDDRNKTSLLDLDQGGQLRRDWEAKNSTLRTWQMSFDHIRRVKSTAAELLALMSLFDRQGIPDDFLQKCISQRPSLTQQDNSVPQSNFGFEDDINTLRDYSFITISPDGTNFGMHRLIQLAMRNWLENQGQLDRWMQQFFSSLHAAFSKLKVKNWPRCEVLFPHVLSALALRPLESSNALTDWALLLTRASVYAMHRGNTAEAITMKKRAMETREKIFGHGHKETLESMDLLTRALNIDGQLEASELWCKEGIKRCKKYGPDDQFATKFKAYLAICYGARGKFKLVEEMQKSVLEANKRTLGVDHVNTIETMTSLAVLYRRQGKLEAAQEIIQEAFRVVKHRFDSLHPRRLSMMAIQASIFSRQCKWDAAEAGR